MRDPTGTGDGLNRDHDVAVPTGALAIEAPVAGWAQQIRPASILERLPDGATGHVAVPLGAFVPRSAPLMWVSPAPSENDSCRTELRHAFALGETRTLQQDIGFGIVQLTDIAVRALSPGVNDPSSANDLIVHLGDVMLALWSQPMADGETKQNGRTLIRRHPRHEEHLRRAFDPIRRYGASDPTVMLTLVRTLRMIVAEAERRSLPGPLEPIDALIGDVVNGVDEDDWANFESDQLAALAQAS